VLCSHAIVNGLAEFLKEVFNVFRMLPVAEFNLLGQFPIFQDAKAFRIDTYATGRWKAVNIPENCSLGIQIGAKAQEVGDRFLIKRP